MLNHNSIKYQTDRENTKTTCTSTNISYVVQKSTPTSTTEKPAERQYRKTNSKLKGLKKKCRIYKRKWHFNCKEKKKARKNQLILRGIEQIPKI